MASNVIKGSNVVFAVRFTDELSAEQTLRVLNQTAGSRSKERDEIELNTKDIEGSDYGKKTESISFEGLITKDDGALEYLESCIDDAKYAEILEVNLETKLAKVGSYMVASLEYDYSDDESATYSFEATLSGDVTEETLTTVPVGDTLSAPIA
jgi:TP901-1 family phage major tail protein